MLYVTENVLLRCTGIHSGLKGLDVTLAGVGFLVNGLGLTSGWGKLHCDA